MSCYIGIVRKLYSLVSQTCHEQALQSSAKSIAQTPAKFSAPARDTVHMGSTVSDRLFRTYDAMFSNIPS